MIKILIKYFLKFFSFTFHFGPLIAIKLVFFMFLTLIKPLYYCNAYKHRIIMGFLKKKLVKTINGFKDEQYKVDISLAENYQVWVLWWQGEVNMPQNVRICYNTLKYYCNGHKVNLLTKDNYKNFVSLPDYILKKAEKKAISITHLSDILRISLLFEHGGLWLDATVLLSAPLPVLPPICSHLGFWTPKDDGNILEVCSGARNWIVREGRWLTFCFYCSKHNILAEFVRAMFFDYQKKYTLFLDYYLFDYFIAIAYDTIKYVRIMIDSVPENNPKVHELKERLNLNSEYNKIAFDELCRYTIFHKLNWSENFREYTEDGKLTYFGYILSNITIQ